MRRSHELALGALLFAMSVSFVPTAFGSAKVLTGEGQALLGKADYDAALAKFNAAIEEDGEFAGAWIGAGQTYEKMQNWPEVKRCYLTVIEFIDDKSYEANLGLGKYFTKAEEFKDAKKHLVAAIKAKSSGAEARYALGHMYHKQGNSAKAKGEYNKAIKINPKADAIVYYRLGRYDFKAGKAKKSYGKAIENYNKYIKNGDDSSILFAVHLDLGTIYRSQKKYAKSLEHYDLAKDVNSDDYRPYYYSAEIFRAQGKTSMAEAEYQEVLKRKSSHGDSHWKLAIIYQQRENWEKAVNHYKSASRAKGFKQASQARQSAAAIEKYLADVAAAEASR